MIINRYLITVEGIVQGVGFRPFVFNLANSLDLQGFVNNNSQGVFIDIEGTEESLKTFLKTLENNSPPLAKIENITYQVKPLINYVGFIIKESEILENTITLISPDIATCQDCIDDIKNPSNRRYRYPFTNCTNCGPRFSIIKAIPYDRDKTTMKSFKMCDSCFSEYTSPINRRFHAQPNACMVCGPQVFITDRNGLTIPTSHPIEWATNALNNGKILAIKGLGGFHLVCDAKNISSIELLRRRKVRPEKPFAVMGKNIDIIKKYCEVNNLEEELLTGIQKPIVLLKRREEYFLPQAIAPKQNTIGFILPFTPLHELLFDNGLEILIMTSGNINSLPLEYDNDNALLNLSTIVDYFLMHNRDIHVPIDDSVVKVVSNEPVIIRRARGYVPTPLKYNTSIAILACGPNMKNTFCISKDNFLFISQHNGDLENLETIEHYKRNIEHYKNIFKFEPVAVACDLHPNYISTEYANEYPLPKIQVQHHHAHIVSCMVENELTDKVIGIAFDGTGYGTDGNIWGGEFMTCTISDFDRLAHLAYVPLPGGDICAHQPWRMAVSYINYAYKGSEDITQMVTSLFGEKALTILSMINSNINCFMTSSMGRFFDAASAILGIEAYTSYEGQASMELEAIIDETEGDSYPYDIVTIGSENIIDTTKIIKGLLIDLKKDLSVAVISGKFHNSVVNFSVDMCNIIRKNTGLKEVALSGGVFQNSYLLKKLSNSLRENNFIVYTHKNFPSNDGGVALGQIAIANELLK